MQSQIMTLISCEHLSNQVFPLCIFQVHLKAQFILNGVCVIWRGWVDLHRLDGTGCLEFDEDRARVRISSLFDMQDQSPVPFKGTEQNL